MSSGQSPAESPRRPLPRWLRVLAALSLVGVALCPAAALSDRLAGRVCILWRSLRGTQEYESYAIIGSSARRSEPDWARETTRLFLQARLLNWNSVRDALLSGNVGPHGRLDPNDRRQMEEAYRDVRRRTSILLRDDNCVEVAHRGPDPHFSASLVNELVLGPIREREREREGFERAKSDLKYYRDKQASARTRLAEADWQLHEFVQASLSLGGSLSELYSRMREASALFADWQALVTRRAAALAQYNEYCMGARANEKDLNRYWPRGYSPNYRIVAYATPATTPAMASSDEVANAQRGAWAVLAAGLLVAATIGVGSVVSGRARRARGAERRAAG